MGWCSATPIFDAICEAILNEKADKKELLKITIEALQDGDWDCERDSKYIDHPLVREAFTDLDPDFFD